MEQLRLIPVAVLTVALIGSPELPTFVSPVGTAVAQEEEEVMTKQRGKKRSRSQVSRPGVEEKRKKR